MGPIDSIRMTQNIRCFLSEKKTAVPKTQKENDTLEISNTAKAFARLDTFLNLGKKGRLDMDDLNPEEKEEFLAMLADLLKNGVVGYEVREKNHRPEKHFIENEIGDHRLYGTKLYKKKYGPPPPVPNLRTSLDS